MKLPGIEYNIRVNLGREDVSQPGRLQASKDRFGQTAAGAFKAVIDRKNKVEEMRDDSDIIKNNVEIALKESALTQQYSGLYVSGDDLPDYLDMERTDASGRPVQVPMSDVYPQIYRKEMDDLIISLSGNIRNKQRREEWQGRAKITLESRYEGEQDQANKQVINEISKTDQVSISRLFDAGMFKQALITTENSTALTSAQKYTLKTEINEAASEAKKERVETHYMAVQEQIVADARGGANVSESLAQLTFDLEKDYKNGIFNRAETNEILRESKVAAYQSGFIGDQRRLIDDGDPVKAFENLDDYLINPPRKGMTQEEIDDFGVTAKSDLTRYLSIKEGQETEEQAGLDIDQKLNSQNLFNGIIDGSTTRESIMTASRLGQINQGQAEKLLTKIESRGKGTTDNVLVNNINQMIADQVSPERIYDLIAKNTGVNLTEGDAGELLSNLSESVSPASIMKREDVKAANQALSDTVKVTGPMGDFTGDAGAKWAATNREFRLRVLAGEDPFIVADSLISKGSISKLVSGIGASFPTLDTSDPVAALETLKQQYANGTIDEGTYNYGVGQLKSLHQAQQSARQLSEGAKNAN